MTSSIRIGAATALALALAACSGGTRPMPGTPPVAAAPAGEVDAILALLDRGDVRDASKRIVAGLKRDPMNPSLHVLQDSISKDPQQLLGPDSYPYTVQAGDTMTALAQRFLGNRLKAYQLARYNKVDKPAALAPGQVLRIPGEPPRPAAPVRRIEAGPRSAPASTARARPVAPAAAMVPRAAANPVAARTARASGLAALNGGDVGRAIALLRRAAALDPANPLIARDLARAQRIAQTVRARR